MLDARPVVALPLYGVESFPPREAKPFTRDHRVERGDLHAPSTLNPQPSTFNQFKRLILRGRRHMFAVGQMIEERHNFGRSQLAGMFPRPRPIPLEFQEPPHPLHIRLLRAQAVMFHPQNLPHLVQQFRFWVGDDERSLCRERFGSHNHTKCNKDGRKRNQNPSVAGRCYTAFSLPNTC